MKNHNLTILMEVTRKINHKKTENKILPFSSKGLARQGLVRLKLEVEQFGLEEKSLK